MAAHDLNQAFTKYIWVTLPPAAPATVDVTTLYTKAIPTVVGATVERDDKNTQLAEYLP